MKIKLLIIAFFCIGKLVAQNVEKGIYKGQKPLFICYLTYTDSIIEVEYFNLKGGQIFGHFPAKQLILNMESFSSKPIFKSKDDSISVFYEKGNLKVKRKGFPTMKVQKTFDTFNDIQKLRNRNAEFRKNLNYR